MILFLYSPFPGCGKTTAAEYLCRAHGFQKVSFADALRNVARTLLLQLDYTEEAVIYYLTSGKNEVIPSLKVTGRFLLQKLGTEFGRKMIHKEIWLQAFSHLCGKIDSEGVARKNGVRLVCDDMRFPNEFTYAENTGGHLVWINRKEAVPEKPTCPAFLQAITWRIPRLRHFVSNFFSFYHPSNNALKGREWQFDYVISNDQDIASLQYTLDMIIEDAVK